jgi:hypothetical protein
VNGIDPVMLITAAIVYGGIAQGAFYPHQALTLAALTLAAGLACKRFGLERNVLAAFGILAAGIAIAWLVAPAGDPRIAASVLIIALGATVVGATQRPHWRSLCAVLTGVGAVAALAGIAGAAWHIEPLALEAQGIWRAASTLTYANSLGAVLVPCLAACAIRLREQDTFPDRLAAAFIVAGLIASISRAAFVSLIVGLVVAIVADREQTVRALKATRTAIIAGGIAGVSVLPAIFHEPHPVWVIAGLLIGAAVCIAPTASRAGSIVFIAGATLVAAGGTFIVATGQVDGIAERIANEDRIRIWRVSLEQGVDSLPQGQGLERFQVIDERKIRVLQIRYAHNEALQAFVETGFTGPLAYGIATVLIGGALWRRRGGNGLELGVGAAFLTHGMLDFVWHVPVVPLLDFLFVGAALSTQRSMPSEGTHL